MTFLWPGLLGSWSSLPLLVAVYVWSLRRRRPAAVRYSSLSLVRDALPALVADPPPPAVRAVPRRARAASPSRSARPVGDRERARRARRRSSWRSTSRAACARPTSRPTGSSRPRPPPRSSSSAQGATTQIGIVAFSGFAELVQAPTNDQELLLDAIQQPDHRAADGHRQRRSSRRSTRSPRSTRASRARHRRPTVDPTAPSRRPSRRAPTRRTSSCCSPTA